MSQQGSGATKAVHPDLFQQIGADIIGAWHKVEWFGEQVLKEGEVLAEHEYEALKTAGVSVLGEFVPKQIAQIRGWVVEYQQKVESGATLLGAAEYCLAMDAAAEVKFLHGELSIGLQVLSGAFVNAL